MATAPYLNIASHAVFELINTLWWGILLGMVMVRLLSHVPREFVISLLGKGGTISGLIRATLAGVLLDLCSHGILMVAAKLYERGVSAGQVMAFLIASPWNSFSLTIILIALIGFKWTLAFIAADQMNRAASPGNSFAFLMSGVATDYTEIMVIKQTTASWKVALALPLISVPQIVLIAWLMNLNS